MLKQTDLEKFKNVLTTWNNIFLELFLLQIKFWSTKPNRSGRPEYEIFDIASDFFDVYNAKKAEDVDKQNVSEVTTGSIAHLVKGLSSHYLKSENH